MVCPRPKGSRVGERQVKEGFFLIHFFFFKCHRWCKKQTFNLGSFPRRRLRFQTCEKFADICFSFYRLVPVYFKDVSQIRPDFFSPLSVQSFIGRLPPGWRYRWQHHVCKFTISPLKRKGGWVGGRPPASCSEALSWPRPLALDCWTVGLRCLDASWTFSARCCWHNRSEAAEASYNNYCPLSSGRCKVGLHGR